LVVTGANNHDVGCAERLEGRSITLDPGEIAQLDVDAVVIEGDDRILRFGGINPLRDDLIWLQRAPEDLNAPIDSLFVL
jgi:hypothetical protein